MFIEENKRSLTVSIAKASGFDHAGYANIDDFSFLPEVRDMCSANRCGKYGTNWACPPGCGTLDEIRARVSEYDYAMILQATEKMEDDFDWDAIEKAQKRCDAALKTLVKQIRGMGKQYLAMGVGGCKKCTQCTYPDAPCRFPDELNQSMEACGLYVNGECEKAGLKYNYGRQTMTIIAMILVKE